MRCFFVELQIEIDPKDSIYCGESCQFTGGRTTDKDGALQPSACGVFKEMRPVEGKSYIRCKQCRNKSKHKDITPGRG
jgi:hypothetical protein